MLNLSMPNATFVQCGLAALVSVLLVSWLRIRPIGVYCLVILGYWLYKTQCNSRVVPPPELKKKLDHIMERVREARENHPRLFCCVMCVALTALAILGHYISGSTVVLAGLALAAILSTKYNFKLVTIEHSDFAWSREVHGFESVTEPDDEFMPEVNESNLFVLERASDLATISSPTEEAEDDEEKSDEIPSELLIPDSIPEIDENSTDEDDEDLVPIISNKADTVASPDSPSGLVFRKRHFKYSSSASNTSSSSDESLSKGLHFPDHNTVVDAPAKRQLYAPSAPTSSQQPAEQLLALAVQSQTQSLLANSGKLLPSLVSGLVQWGMSGGGGGGASSSSASSFSAEPKVERRVVSALDSSDDSDFEILETDDFK